MNIKEQILKRRAEMQQNALSAFRKGEMLTISEIADILEVPPHRVDYVIRKHRIRSSGRVALVRLYSEKQIPQIKDCVIGIRIKKTRDGV